MTEFQNAIRINHRGFKKDSQKRFILTEPSGDSSFSVIYIKDACEYEVYKGTLEAVTENGHEYYVGDFSSLTDEGDYYVRAGGYVSRQFVIYDGAYDICQRTLLEYFTYQRCGHPLGWAGRCHLDDGYIKETGEHVDLSGGYHQSCDLRKSPGGISIGVHAMLNFAISDKTEWGEILTYDEVKWACDYYVKTIQENGAMYNTLNDPFGWEGRVFYKSPAPSSAQWNVTCVLALGYIYMKERDPSLAKKYLDASLRSYSFLVGEERPSELYRHPDKYQLGMDPDFFYDQCKKDSNADIAYQICAAATLYKATGDKALLERIQELLPRLLDAIPSGTLPFALLRDDDEKRLITASCSYTWSMGGLFALLDAYELLGDVHGLRDTLVRLLDSVCETADKNVFRYLKGIYSDSDLDTPAGHTNHTRREEIGALSYIGDIVSSGEAVKCYSQSAPVVEPSIVCYYGIFLARGARLLSEKKYMDYAQSVLDLILGANALDSSLIRSIGYNHAQHKSYGQFFPSTPFIVGAVGVGYGEIDVYKSNSEYDMPCVGLTMYLISEINK